MTSKSALAQSLIEGKTVNIMTGFRLFGITNIPREISRSIERCFDVEVKRIPRKAVSRYGQPCIWMDYKLIKNERNKEGIKRMKLYIKKSFTSNEKK